MDSAYEMGHIRKLQAQHVADAGEDFTKWINSIFQHGRGECSWACPTAHLYCPPKLPGQWTLGDRL